MAEDAQSSDLQQLNQRIELRKKNLSPKPIGDDELARLDGSIKKTTSFIKKLKTALTGDQLQALTKELLSLKLEKYISEVVAAILEAKITKSAHYWAAVEISSLLHQRFSNFQSLLASSITKSFGPPPNTSGLSAEQKEREESARVSKQRMHLRLYVELTAVGVIRDVGKGKEPSICTILKEMLNLDKEFANVPIAVSLVKSHLDTLLAPTASDESTTSTLADQLFPPTVRQISRGILVDYYRSVSKYLVRMHKHIRKMELANYENAIARGEVSEERQERFQKGLKIYEKLLANVQSLSTGLGEEMPELPEQNEAISATSMGIAYGGKEREEKDGVSGGVWDDEESRLFYEDIPDLKLFVPTILLGEKVDDTKVEPTEGQSKQEEQVETSPQETTPTGPAEDDKEDDVDETAELEEPEDGNLTGKVAMDALLVRLPNAMSRDTIDQIAVEFCYNNSKSARKKLVKHVATVSRQRLDILPYYSRLVTILSKYMPDVAQGIVQYLDKEFRSQQRRRDKVAIEDKIKTVRYIAELAKFRVAPSHLVLYVVKVLIDEFYGHNIEVLCNMLESCGRFLYKSPETATKMSALLETMMRKKTVHALDSRLAMLVDNAFYLCNPPEYSSFTPKVRKPMEAYVRKLMYSDLSRRNIERVTKQLRKLNWEDETILSYIRKPFFKPWKLKFSAIPLLAFLTSELGRYYPEFMLSVVDNCLEEVRLGLETNVFKNNQRRIACAKLLGELYNYRVVDNDIIFDTLYFILRFGYATPFPEPGSMSTLDAPYDFFRVRLCCTLLETCGLCFDKGSLAKKLDEFLAFMQVYITAKPQVTVDVEFLVTETLELLRPKQTFIQDYEEAVEKFNSLVSSHVDPNSEVADAESESDEGEDTREARVEQESDTEEETGENELESGDDAELAEDDEDEEEIVVHVPEETKNEEEEALFELEFSKMMQESLESRKLDRKPQTFDVAIPAKVKFQQNNDEEDRPNEDRETVTFALMTKRGNKSQLKALELPKDSSFALSTKQKLEAEQQEKMQLKKLVLSLNEEREREELLASGGSPAPKTNGRVRKVIMSTNSSRFPKK